MNLHEALLYKNILGSSGGGLPSGNNGDVLTYVSSGDVKISFKERYTDEELAEMAAIQAPYMDDIMTMIDEIDNQVYSGDYSQLPLIIPYTTHGDASDGFPAYDMFCVATYFISTDGKLIVNGYITITKAYMEALGATTDWISSTGKPMNPPTDIEIPDTEFQKRIFEVCHAAEITGAERPTGEPKWEARESIIKSVLCDTSIVWTEDEQAAAREKLGLINVAEVGA